VEKFKAFLKHLHVYVLLVGFTAISAVEIFKYIKYLLAH
jgi:hypothetical protein